MWSELKWSLWFDRFVDINKPLTTSNSIFQSIGLNSVDTSVYICVATCVFQNLTQKYFWFDLSLSTVKVLLFFNVGFLVPKAVRIQVSIKQVSASSSCVCVGSAVGHVCKLDLLSMFDTGILSQSLSDLDSRKSRLSVLKFGIFSAGLASMCSIIFSNLQHYLILLSCKCITAWLKDIDTEWRFAWD